MPLIETFHTLPLGLLNQASLGTSQIPFHTHPLIRLTFQSQIMSSNGYSLYAGQIREQSQHSPTLSPPFLLPKNKPRVFGEKSGGREATIGLNSAEHGDSDDYRKNVEKTAVPTLSPTILSSTECPPNSTVNNTVEGGIEVVRQLAASNHQTYWGHALGVVIGVGCCFLFLNVLVYIAIYHQRIQR